VRKKNCGILRSVDCADLRAAEQLLTDYSLLPLDTRHNRVPFATLAFDPYSHIPHDPSHSELAGLGAKALELTIELLSKEGCTLLYCLDRKIFFVNV
jgi:hypothetical protein